MLLAPSGEAAVLPGGAARWPSSGSVRSARCDGSSMWVPEGRSAAPEGRRLAARVVVDQLQVDVTNFWKSAHAFVVLVAVIAALPRTGLVAPTNARQSESGLAAAGEGRDRPSGAAQSSLVIRARAGADRAVRPR